LLNSTSCNGKIDSSLAKSGLENGQVIDCRRNGIFCRASENAARRWTCNRRW
jgi:hypothetical protein